MSLAIYVLDELIKVGFKNGQLFYPKKRGSLVNIHLIFLHMKLLMMLGCNLWLLFLSFVS